MKPGQINLNELEEAILKLLAKEYPSLGKLISQLSVLSREFTGVGSYTNFRCLASSDELGNQQIGLQALISIPSVPNGLGGVLFCENGKPMFLELFTYGDDKWDGVYDGFKIKETA
jgi:hypothetical protein